MRFEGKTALVTGAEGVRVAATDRDCSGLEAEAHFEGDLMDPEFCDDLPAQAAETLGRLDILCNNTGVITRGDIHPVGRTGSAEEVARLICWLASDEARFVPGQIYTINGGRTAQLSLP